MSSKNEMTFLEHLEVFRKHLVRSVIAVLIGAILAFIFKKVIFDYIIFAPREEWFPTNRFFCFVSNLFNSDVLCINNSKFILMNVDLGGQFNVHLMVSIIVGIVLAVPYIIYQLWCFVRPALKDGEKKHSKGIIFFSSFLFLLGILFGYYLIVPLTINFFGTYFVSDEVVNQINIKSFISTVTNVSLASGLIFELPIIVFFLSKIGMLTPDFLIKYRKHAIVVVFILAGIITPPDIFSQLLVAFPLILLYQISIRISRKVNKK